MYSQSLTLGTVHGIISNASRATHGTGLSGPNKRIDCFKRAAANRHWSYSNVPKDRAKTNSPITSKANLVHHSVTFTADPDPANLLICCEIRVVHSTMLLSYIAMAGLLKPLSQICRRLSWSLMSRVVLIAICGYKKSYYGDLVHLDRAALIVNRTSGSTTVSSSGPVRMKGP